MENRVGGRSVATGEADAEILDQGLVRDLGNIPVSANRKDSGEVPSVFPELGPEAQEKLLR